MENPILKIDWSELRNQKSSLLAVIGYYEHNNVHCIADHLTGILHLIDSIQDYAVDELGVNEMHVYDFEQEDARDSETPQEYFARTNASIIYEMHIEGTALYEHEEMPEDFINKILHDRMHVDIIKATIKNNILEDVLAKPDNFKKNSEGNLTYDAEMYDYGFAIEAYCLEKFYEGKTKEVWLCGNCGSDSIESHAMVNPNAMTDNPELINTDDSESNYCFDCKKRVALVKTTIPYLAKNAKKENDDIYGTTDGHIDPKNR